MNEFPVEAQNLREEYLLGISARLAEEIGALELYGTISEMRDHLNAATRAYSELGVEITAAMSLAIRDFGMAGDIAKAHGRQLSSVRDVSRKILPLASAMVSATISGALLLILSMIAFCGFHPLVPVSLDGWALIGASVGYVLMMGALKYFRHPLLFATGSLLVVNLLYRIWSDPYQRQMANNEYVHGHIMWSLFIFVLALDCCRIAAGMKRGRSLEQIPALA